MNKILDHIKALEEKLLHSDVRKNPEILNELLSEDFEEIGSSGKISSREQVIHWLITKEKDIQYSLNNFRIRELAPGLVLATYVANKKGILSSQSNGSIRSSIWRLSGENWKMIFHQGTKILEK
jgi:hypothetical protein